MNWDSLNTRHYILKIHQKIEDIGKSTWNKLSSGRSLYLNYEWFSLHENDHVIAQARFYLIVSNRKSEKPLAILPCFLVTDPKNYAFYNVPDVLIKNELNDSVLLDSDAKSRYSHYRHILETCDFYPHLYISSPSGYFCDLIHQKEQTTMILDDVVELLFEGIQKIVEKTHARLTAFLYVPYENTLYKTLLKRHYQPALLFADCVLDLNYTSFENYCQTLPKKTRQSIRRETKILHTKGASIECINNIKPYISKITELGNNVLQKYGHFLEDEENEALWFERVADLFENKTWLYIFKKQNQIAGFVLYFKEQNTFYPKRVGFDYDLLESSDFAYFNLCFNIPIQTAIESGIKKIDYGAGAYRAKLKRGCRLEPKYGFFDFTAYSATTAKTLQAYTELFHQNNELYWASLG